MNIFKAACKILLNNKMYFLMYVVFLGAIGVFVATGNTQGATSDEFVQNRADVAVIDRDGGALASGVTEAMASNATMVEVADTERSLQDAVAQGMVDCLIIVPEGYGETFVEAVRAGDEPPCVQTVASFDNMAGFEVENQLQMYLSCVAARTALSGEETAQEALSEAATAALDDMAEQTTASYAIEEGKASPLPDDFLLYNRWSVYPIVCAIGVLVTVTLAGFNRTDVRRRNLSAPVSSLSLSLGLSLASVVCMLITWVWFAGLGLVAFGGSLEGTDTWRVVLCLVDLFAYAVFALAFGFLLAQLGASVAVANSAANIVGLVLSFLGGAWIDIRLMGQTLETVGHFTPSYWHGQALVSIAQADGATWDALAPAIADMGIVFLFAAALFAVALVVGRVRLGNAGTKERASSDKSTPKEASVA
ncbi:ABC transporter permease [Adlercreutzia sp. ZJ141]|uniref:ABC transporter permease n=1 Tax=Adlercreutzia sp. ZJ141 TaxID=2709406 RepID=UPI0013EBD9A6|nr:ABC transporter permease [Adlercreutzia sp. ZJ141]